MTKSKLFLSTETPGRFLHHPATKAWLGQFDEKYQVTAADLLGAVRLVSRDAFVTDLRLLIAQRIAEGPGPIGLYAEREIRKTRGIPNAIFQRTRAKCSRAVGDGPVPVEPTRAYNPEVGSEGIVAHLITELCRSHGRKALNHPGPDEIRKKKVRRFILVTDLIGTGNRAFNYLQAAWKVETIKSWRSLGLMQFEVVAYAATADGLKKVRLHRCRPRVEIVAPCPTINSVFSGKKQALMEDMCVRYDPVDNDPVDSLGYGGQGCLIAFGHGVPNNAPRILHRGVDKSAKKWAALFPARVTADLARTFDEALSPEAVARRLKAMRQRRLATSPWVNENKPDTYRMMLLLASLSRMPRSDIVIAIRCGLTLLDVRDLLDKALASRWIEENRRLTDLGHSQLGYARKQVPANIDRQPTLPKADKLPYYPQSLRAPTS